MQGVYSSRKIQSACQRDINYIWLLDGAPAPSHNGIARFRSIRLAECGEELFYRLVRKLGDLGEIKFEHLFVDGTRTQQLFENRPGCHLYAYERRSYAQFSVKAGI